ncbi:MAG: M1 family metallopeptidase [Bacteroidota bacterium]
MPEQAAYDVRFYDLTLSVHPSDSSINGSVIIRADVVQPIDMFVVDLDTLLTISGVAEIGGKRERERSFRRDVGKIWITLQRTRQAGESITLLIRYGGRPRIAPRPPRNGGFTWSQTKDSSAWIATTCQGEGPDIWWPAKDHVSDEPDSMGIHIRVPDPLICASNGRLISVEKHNDKTSTYHWFVSNPINNYNVALNIAPYKLIEDTYKSVAGDLIPVQFYVLPEDYEKGQKLFPQLIEHLNFFERTLGPYPFRADKYGVAHTPHLGMEHQTIIAYGAGFKNETYKRKDWGFDALHHHELSHEWWGNLVTNSDWRDMWLHEGFGTYMQALYVEEIDGIEAYHEYIASERSFTNRLAIAPRESQTASQITKAPIYPKGASVLHTLRYLVGEEAFRKILRRMAYPYPWMEKITDGRQVRFASTDDFVRIAEKVSGRELGWFFELYVRQPELPELKADLSEGKLSLAWGVPDGLPFPMPIDLKLGEETRRVVIPAEGLVLDIKPGIIPEIDPDRWVLLDPYGKAEAIELTEKGEYKEARRLFEKVLFVDPDNKIMKNLVRHLDYALENPDKLESNFFDVYVGKYKSNRGTILEVYREAGDLHFQYGTYMEFKLYPMSDSEFTILDAERVYTFVKDEDGNVTELVGRRGSYEKIE